MIKLSYNSVGKGDCVFIFLHGNSLSSKIFDYQIEELSRNFKVFAFDLPGHGNSPVPHKYQIKELSKILIDTINDIKGEKHIIAHSLSGHLIYQQINNLIGVSSILTIGSPPLENTEAMSRAFSETGTLLHQETWNDSELHKLATYFSASHASLISKQLKQSDPGFRRALATPDFFTNFSNEISNLNHCHFSVTMLFSQDDLFINLSYLDEIEKSINNPSVKILKRHGGSHLPFLNDPKMFTKLLSNVSGKQI